MNELVSYLLAQARYRPVATAQFAAGELWRRSRLRLVNSLEARLPEFTTFRLGSRFAPLLPATAHDGSEYSRRYPAAGLAALSQADAILRHELEIFGEQAALGAEMDWHRDWKSGHRWPLETPGNLRLVDSVPGADVKRPWEVARFHHLLTLGKAYRVSRDARYAAEFAAQVRHWIRGNPYPRGIHWAMPMEVAIRAVNWATAAAFFTDAEQLDEAFWQDFLRALYLHGRYAFAQREWNPVARGNHYLACIVGPLFLGGVFSEQAEAQQWLEFARRELGREMEAQVGKDGVAHEGSSGYHAFLTELFFSSALALARFDARHSRRSFEPRSAMLESCGAEFVGRLEKMFAFLAAIVAGRARPPVWGDADDGRLLPMCSGEASAAGHLLAVGRALFERKDWPAGCEPCEETWWRIGCGPRSVPPFAGETKEGEDAGRRTTERGAVQPFPPAGCKAFEQAGFFFFAGKRLRGSVRCGPLGVNGWANHAHCDQLSYEFCWDGKAVLTDPGTYLYSGDAGQRNLFRGSRAHNSVLVNGAEQNRFWPGLLFRMVDDTRSKLLEWKTDERRVEFAGEHRGYLRLPERVRVERRIVLERESDCLFVRDTLRGNGTARLEWYLHLAPGLDVERMSAPVDAAAWSAQDGIEREKDVLRAAWRLGPVVLRVWAAEKIREMQFVEERGWIAPRYGQRVEAAVVHVSAQAMLPAQVTFTFEEC